MYTRVTKDQFEIRDGVYIHKPTHAEFAPNPISKDSLVVYTADIGSRLESGELYDYREVLKEIKSLLEQKSDEVDRQDRDRGFFGVSVIASDRV
jgi:hypothetical protein